MTNNGIFIYDETLDEIINKKEIAFNSNYNQNYLYKDDDYILIIANNHVYLFSSTGEYLMDAIASYIYPVGNRNSIVPYGYSNNSYYFYSIYNQQNSNSAYYIKYNYNLSSNTIISSSSKTINQYSYFCSDSTHETNYISCQSIYYSRKKSFICFFTGHLGSYIYMYIFDKEFNVLEDDILYQNYNYIVAGKGISKNRQKILLIISNFVWYGYDILEDNYNSTYSNYTYTTGKMSCTYGCSLIKNINIYYYNETEEFIVSFSCSNYKYIFIYSFDNNFNCNFLGTIRPFIIEDSNNCCGYNNYNNVFSWEIHYSFLFSSITERYLIIGNLEEVNSISTFIINKDIKIVTKLKLLKLFGLPNFICEDYNNLN